MLRNGEGGAKPQVVQDLEVFINNVTKINALITGISNTAFSSPQNSDSGYVCGIII